MYTLAIAKPYHHVTRNWSSHFDALSPRSFSFNPSMDVKELYIRNMFNTRKTWNTILIIWWIDENVLLRLAYYSSWFMNSCHTFIFKDYVDDRRLTTCLSWMHAILCEIKQLLFFPWTLLNHKLLWQLANEIVQMLGDFVNLFCLRFCRVRFQSIKRNFFLEIFPITI